MQCTLNVKSHIYYKNISGFMKTGLRKSQLFFIMNVRVRYDLKSVGPKSHYSYIVDFGDSSGAKKRLKRVALKASTMT